MHKTLTLVRRRLRVLVPAAALVAASAFTLAPVGASANGVALAQITGDLSGNSVHGRGFTPGNTLSVVVKSGTDTLYSNTGVGTDAMGQFMIMLGQQSSPVTLAAGMNITVTDNTYPEVVRELTVVPLAITGIDPATRTVTGTTAAGATVNVGIQTGSGPVVGAATANESGAWTYTFAEGVVLSPTTFVNAAVNDADMDATAFSMRLFGGWITADLTSNQVRGQGYTPNSTVNVSVALEPGGTVVYSSADVPTDPGGGGFTVALSTVLDPVTLTGGMYVSATDTTHPTYVKDLVVDPLSIDTIDVATGVVSGTSGSSSQVNVGTQGPGGRVGGMATKDSENPSHWSFTFPAGVLTVASMVGTSVNDPDGDMTGFNRQLFGGNISADLSGNSVMGGNFTPSSTVTVVVKESPGASENLYSNAAVATDGNGSFWVPLNDANPAVTLVGGMHVTVTDNTTQYAKEVTVAALSIDTIGRTSGEVTGTATPGATVGVGIWTGSSQPTGGQTQADPGGAWSYTFDSALVSAGAQVGASIQDQDGDSTGFSRQVFTGQIDVNLSQNVISGNGFSPTANVSLTVADGDGGQVYAGTVQTGGGGEFWVEMSTQDPVVTMAGGMYVSANDDTTGWLKELWVAHLAITTINPATNTVSGTAENGQWVDLGVQATGGESGRVQAGASGQWSHTFGYDITPSTMIGASVSDQDGDTTGYNRQAFAGSINVDMTGDWVQANGFTPNARATVQVSSAGGAVLRSTRVTTDASGQFWYQPLNAKLTNLTAGLRVTVTDLTTGFAVSGVLEDVTFDTLTTAGHAEGTAPAGTQVYVSAYTPQWEGLWQSTTAGQDNTWQVDFGQQVTLDGAAVNVDSGEGAFQTGVSFKRPSVQGNLTTDAVSGQQLAEAAQVTVKIYAPGNTTTPVYQRTVTTDGSGGFTLERKVHRLDLVAGMRITVTYPNGSEPVRTLDLATFAITSMAFSPTFSMSGTSSAASAGATVFGGYDLYRQPAGNGALTTAAADGTWSVSTSDTPDPRSTAWAALFDSDGDSTVVDWVSPRR